MGNWKLNIVFFVFALFDEYAPFERKKDYFKRANQSRDVLLLKGSSDQSASILEEEEAAFSVSCNCTVQSSFKCFYVH